LPLKSDELELGVEILPGALELLKKDDASIIKLGRSRALLF
jgi:hypothetical protein